MEKHQDTTSNVQIQSLKERVSLDLQTKLKDYRDQRVGVRLLSKKMDLSERTISRILSKENRPTYQTLFKIYKEVFSTSSHSKILELAPEVVANEIKKHCPEIKEEKSPMPKIENELLYDRCFSELYIMAGCGPISIEFARYRYGLHGVETLEKMIELRALKIDKNGQYSIGDNKPDFSPSIIKRVGLNIAEKFCKPKNGEVGGDNLIGFYADGLTDEAYDEWLKVDERAFREKLKISKKSGSKGTKKVFTYMVTDTFSEK